MAEPIDDLRDVPCADRSGFLFDHPCGHLARLRCAQCRKPICERHRHVYQGQGYCTACARPHAEESGWYDDSPYFYGRRYHPGYRSYWLFDDEPDYDDFTVADGASTVAEADEPFENDLGAS